MQSSSLVRNPRNDDPAITALRRRMDEFYKSTTEYSAFLTPVDHSDHFASMAPLIDKAIREKGHIRVLELGAGKPTFPRYFSSVRGKITYHVQDVTAQNREYLLSVADNVLIGDISQVKEQYDLVFSTFVLEHVSTPEDFLEQVARLLSSGGIHVVICPRYDMPGYVAPSTRHLPLGARWVQHLFLLGSRIAAHLDRKPRFWVNCSPAMLHTKWFRDADAVHLVSRFDIEQWHKRHGFAVERLTCPTRGLKQTILSRHLTVALACRKK